MSKVYFIKDNFIKKLEPTLKKFPLEKWNGKSVAVKLHMGEYGNLNYVRPPIAGRIVEILKEAGANPFLYDSTTKYKVKRYTVEDYYETARKNGFTEETMGCPIVISNNGIEKDGKLFPVHVIKEIAEADAMLVLSHCKGHPFTSLGAAIKNIGMGCIDRDTKKLCHDKANMVVDLEKCVGCGICINVCPVNAIRVEGKKAVIDYEKCWGCAKCFKACNQQAMSPKELMPDTALASCTLPVLECFDKKDLLYVNVLMDISEMCDCHGDAKLGEMPDIGFLVSDNILAIDSASADLINKAFGKDFFDSIGYRDPKLQVKWLEEQGYGNSDYELVEV
ncbi:MAG: DUF362 domain-containing protein [Candidatus Diapherotrites archaeon]|uniref:DUF362 domain-containing protein n=1 Tax=Candidatus Iainarchaeum sp. TaxID=3101447 RepID=A0A939CAF4_9ARCH|nr:DUF362 domain-containing protein [Candidatus Diapherotrites archaeon]